MYDKRKVAKTYRKFVTGTMALVFVAAGVATATFSFSWFTNKNNIVNKNLNGKTAGAYFARGKGTSTDPYVINKPIHLYNLAWLQYIGYFKEETYFIIESDLDMSGWVLPPIGTTDHPFIGHLDGYDATYSKTGQSQPAKIKNLTISNDFEDFSSRHPGSVTSSTFTSPNITGLFGVVGDTSSTIEPTIQNLYLDKITVKSTTDNALTGIVAGYVNGKLDNIYLSDSSLDVKDGTNKLTGYDNISKYTSVGYCENKYQTEAAKYKTTMYEPAYVGDASFNPSGGGDGQDNDWGGSIDIASFAKRLNYIARSENGNKTPAKYETDESANFNAYLGYYNNGFDWSDVKTAGQFVALRNGTYMPLNIDLKTATISGDYSGSMGSYYLSSDGQSKGEPILSTNTGYVVGKGSSTSSCTPRLWNKTFNSTSTAISGYGIQYSINATDQAKTISAADEDGDGIFDIFASKYISFFYYDTTGNKTYRITDAENSATGINWSNTVTSSTIDVGNCGFGDIESGYYNVKKQFSKMLSEGNTSAILGSDSININGIQFFRDTSAITKDSFSNVTINGVQYDSFEMLKGGLNFELKNSGSIKAVVTTCTNDATQYFPPLYEVFRSDDKKTISSWKQISAIYQSSDGKIYYHQYTDNSASIPTDAKKIFDIDKIVSSVGLSGKCAYYVEIPLNAGDYWFGPCSKNNCSYISYLDIGANSGGGDTGTKVQRTKIYEVLEQINEAFTYPTGISVVSFDNAVLDTKTLCITLGSTYSGTASIKRTSSTAADITVTTATSTGLYYFDPELTVTNNSQTITDSELVKGEETTTKTRRLTYLDYYKETKITNMYAFEQTQENGSTAWSDITLGEYASGEGDTDFSSTSGLTIYNDEGKSITTSDITIEEPSDYGSGTVFSLTLKENKPDDFSINYVPVGAIDETTYKFTVSGYKFTLNDVTKYSVTSRNESYSLNINGTDIS